MQLHRQTCGSANLLVLDYNLLLFWVWWGTWLISNLLSALSSRWFIYLKISWWIVLLSFTTGFKHVIKEIRVILLFFLLLLFSSNYNTWLPIVQVICSVWLVLCLLFAWLLRFSPPWLHHLLNMLLSSPLWFDSTRYKSITTWLPSKKNRYDL